VSRYLAASPPSAAAMGTDGSILCHVLYAWALSYGVDETGVLDVEEGGESPDGPIDLVTQSVGEVKREHDRMARKARMEVALRYILKEIDEAGILRKPSWDGVRALLMILPLTDGTLACWYQKSTDHRRLLSCRAAGHVRSGHISSLHVVLLHWSWL